MSPNLEIRIRKTPIKPNSAKTDVKGSDNPIFVQSRDFENPLRLHVNKNCGQQKAWAAGWLMDKNSVKTHFNDTHDVAIVRSPEMVKKLF